MSAPVILPPGLWTPFAQILCWPCHGYDVRQCGQTKVYSPDLPQLQPREIGDYEAVAVCDKCGTKIWLDEDVAREQEAVLALRKAGYEASMQQTGGMCSAAGVLFKDGRYVFITAEERYYASCYDDEEAAYGCDRDDAAPAEGAFETLDELVTQVRAWEASEELSAGEIVDHLAKAYCRFVRSESSDRQWRDLQESKLDSPPRLDPWSWLCDARAQDEAWRELLARAIAFDADLNDAALEHADIVDWNEDRVFVTKGESR